MIRKEIVLPATRNDVTVTRNNQLLVSVRGDYGAIAGTTGIVFDLFSRNSPSANKQRC